MAKKKAFLLRVDPALLSALEKWAADDLRSLNGQIEFLLRNSLSKAGRKLDKVPETAPQDVTPEHPGSRPPKAKP